MKRQLQLNVIACIFIIAGIIGYGISSIVSPEKIESFFENVSTELIGIGFTVGIVDYYYQQRDEKELKERLIIEMGSRDNTMVSRAVRELDVKGWLRNGEIYRRNFREADFSNTILFGASLEYCWFSNTKFHRAILSQANLKGANFLQADMRGVDLISADLELASLHNAVLEGAKLQRANLTDTGLQDDQLIAVCSLMGAIMSDGSIYDGRYRLKEEVEVFHKRYEDESDENWAEFYGVSLEKYLKGQKWANENLHKYRKDEEE